MKVNVYVDGFNLYYGCLKNSKYKWLNLAEVCSHLFPKDNINLIKYYTARIGVRPNYIDLDKPIRQQLYLRALKTIPNLKVVEGNFLVSKVKMMKSDYGGFVKVIKTEEKGTDVNLASHLILDGCKGEYEMAVVVSNDSDLVEPVKIVTRELNLPVIVVSPFKFNTLNLKQVASSVRQIREGVLRISQFPDQLSDGDGIFTKPQGWI